MYTVNGTNGNAAEFAIGKYPNLVPTFNNLEWTSYNNLVQNFTISSWDPAFDGGTNCGPYGTDTCELYIGIFGYCVNSEPVVNFLLEITLTINTGVYESPQNNQKIAPNGVKNYLFCVNKTVDSDAILQANRDACDCPTNYTNLQVAVSKSNKQATLEDRVWRLDDRKVGVVQAVPLYQSDLNTRPGACQSCFNL
jgi:hypothetical protein